MNEDILPKVKFGQLIFVRIAERTYFIGIVVSSQIHCNIGCLDIDVVKNGNIETICCLVMSDGKTVSMFVHKPHYRWTDEIMIFDGDF